MRHTFIVSCSLDYLFALNCTMNAAKYYGTNADFWIIYDQSISKEVRDSYEGAFPFKVKWYSLDLLLAETSIDSKQIMSKFWIAAWVLASRLVYSYDSVCILQADEFLVVNVNHWFKIAALTGMVIASEWTCSNSEFEDLEFGVEQAEDDEGNVVLFDQLVFVNQQNRALLEDTYLQQIAKGQITQANHPMSSLCRACRKHLTKDKVIGLDGHTWCWDRDEFDFRINWDPTNKKFYNERKIKVNGIHTKVWKAGLDQSALDRCADQPARREIALHNFNTIKDVMIEFNEMTPAVKQENYCKERFR